MFEKEAEDYSEKDLGGKYLSSVVAKDKLHAYKLGQYDGFVEGAEYGYNKAKEEMKELGLALQSDMDKTIEQNIALKKQIEKLIDFVLSKTECCDVCPITDTCINSEGTCPYAGILAKGEEVTRKWLIQFISRR